MLNNNKKLKEEKEKQEEEYLKRLQATMTLLVQNPNVSPDQYRTIVLTGKYDKLLITKKETAHELSISEGTLDRLRQSGQIQSRKVLGQIMFDIGEVARFLADA